MFNASRQRKAPACAEAGGGGGSGQGKSPGDKLSDIHSGVNPTGFLAIDVVKGILDAEGFGNGQGDAVGNGAVAVGTVCQGSQGLVPNVKHGSGAVAARPPYPLIIHGYEPPCKSAAPKCANRYICRWMGGLGASQHCLHNVSRFR